MNTNNISSDVNRRIYASHQIEQVLLDNVISSTLDSLMTPSIGPDESALILDNSLDQPIGLL